MPTLTDELDLMAAWFDAERQPDHGWTEARRDAFAAKLRQLARHAEALEGAVRMLEARQLAPIDVSAVLDGLRSGSVVLLGTHRTVVAHGLDAGSDRRFGEDAGGAT